MELRYVVMTILKILISVPTVMLIATKDVNGAALMGGHLDNKNGSTAPMDSSLLSDYELYDDQELDQANLTTKAMDAPVENSPRRENGSEEIPDPSPLVVPGYNLPENIFNRGKPFFLERDPLTGIINFDSKPSLSDVETGDSPAEYEDYPSRSDMFDKSNIDRKDTSYGSSHKSSDVNQLVPNFHDFLNLPVKYNSDKYVYPLISSSYANTKVQGNVNKHHQNHKNYVVTPPTAATTSTYYYTTKSSTQPPTRATTEASLAPEEYEEYEYTTKRNINNIYLTTSRLTTTTTTPATTATTKKPLSLFQQLFGDYEETETEATPPAPRNVTSTTPANTVGENYYEYEYDDDIVDESKVKPDQQPAENARITTTAAPLTNYHYSTITERISTTTTTTTTTPPPTTTSITTTTGATSTKLNSHQTLNALLASEKVVYQNVPSTTVHVPAHQDTVSFLVGNHHQNVMGGEFVGSVVEDNLHQVPNLGVDKHQQFSSSGSSVTLHPFKQAEASLTIGVPVEKVKGQVVDEKLDSKNKVVFPDEKQQTAYVPELKPPKLPPPPPNREILKLNSRPMYHQLPSSLTPPKEPEINPIKFGASRPPWDPRPDRFFRPQSNSRPQFDPNLAHKRVDSLPNILPQFRPNAYQQNKRLPPPPPPPHFDQRHGHVGVFEKLQPPPPPPKYLTALRKAAFPPERAAEKPPKRPPPPTPPPNYYRTPPQLSFPNRRQGTDELEVETLQMLQAKHQEREEDAATTPEGDPEKPLYVVYPVNTPPLKLDAFDAPKKESVVIGTRAELPLPPSRISAEHQGDLFNAKDRNDAPVLRPHPKPARPDFPYPLEKPEPAEQEGRISVTLRTHAERPIAVAYTPTEAPQKGQAPPQDFEAPFQASVSVDSAAQGWSVVREKGKAEAEQEATTVAPATTSEFDIENFKPQLIGGFVPIYDYPENEGGKTGKQPGTVVKDRRER